MQPETPARREVFTVGALNRRVRTLLENQLGLIWVSGEISNFSSPGSGHWYFTLKDSDAQVRCAMFRNKSQYLGFKPKDGQQVLVRARVSLYEPRGDYQLIAEYLEEAGQGALQRAFDQLKARLAAEGLFDGEHKKPLPAYPRCVGVVTSASGAAVRDILSVLKTRMPTLPVIVYPTPVQGAEAVPQLVRALASANRRAECDVLIVGRGGGSLEDLWCFNDERLARAIHASVIPVVSAVGHEIDVTIADFVADWRAPTPSAAAEAVSPDRVEEAGHVRHLQSRLATRLLERLSYERQHVEHLSRRLPQPARELERKAQRLDELRLRLKTVEERAQGLRRQRLERLAHRVALQDPARQLERRRYAVNGLAERLRERMQRRLEATGASLAGLARALDAVSPLTTLARGYSISFDPDSGRALRSIRETAPGRPLETRLKDGRILSRVLEVQGTDDAP